MLPSTVISPLEGPIDCGGGDRVIPVKSKSHISIHIRAHIAYDDNTKSAWNLDRRSPVGHHREEKLEYEDYPRKIPGFECE
jgi:hypothetical protein